MALPPYQPFAFCPPNLFGLIDPLTLWRALLSASTHVQPLGLKITCETQIAIKSSNTHEGKIEAQGFNESTLGNLESLWVYAIGLCLICYYLIRSFMWTLWPDQSLLANVRPYFTARVEFGPSVSHPDKLSKLHFVED